MTHVLWLRVRDFGVWNYAGYFLKWDDVTHVPILYAIYVNTNMGAHFRASLLEMTVGFSSKLSCFEAAMCDTYGVYIFKESSRA